MIPDDESRQRTSDCYSDGKFFFFKKKQKVTIQTKSIEFHLSLIKQNPLKLDF